MRAGSGSRVGVIAIGRNEGERFKLCLQSIPDGTPVVYVDSGSTDGSVAYARERGVTVVELDTSIPFTAARARNAGLAEIGYVEFVQMIDGDCTLDPEWLGRAVDALDAEPELAGVFGRCRERFPEASIYNRLCDDEWNVPIGLVHECGGNAMFRHRALEEVGGYAPELIAGEEPEMCLRMRRRGWLIRRIEGEMVKHDAAIHRFGQWWRRMERGGYAASNLYWRTRNSADGWSSRHIIVAACWAIGLPLATLLLTSIIGWPGLLFLLIYPLQVVRIAVRSRRQGKELRTAWARGLLFTVGKFPHLIGVGRFFWRLAMGRRATLIEYK